MKRIPRVSVCIPTRNRAGYLRQALESVRQQSIQDLEIIVYDDASQDETKSAVEEFGDSRIRYFEQSNCVGIPANRNSCLAVARGRYIAWLDSDDVYLPDMLATQLAALERFPDAGIVHGGFHVIGADGHRLPDWPLPFSRDTFEPSREAFGELALLNYITAPTVVVRRECHERAGAYATDLGPSSTDWDMWLRIVVHAGVAYTSVPVAAYRQHPGSISSETEKSGERLRCDIAVIEHVWSLCRDSIADADRVRRRADAALGLRALRAAAEAVARGDRAAALEFARLAESLATPVVAAAGASELLRALAHGSEYLCHRLLKRALSQIDRELAGSRFAERHSKVARENPTWEGTLARIGEAVRRVVPANGRIAVVDKCDPTILYLSGRPGCHFPDPAILPDGYPAESGAAIEHLEQLRASGARYLVIPISAFWWLEHYAAFREHLERCGSTIWRDGDCVIYHFPADYGPPG